MKTIQKTIQKTIAHPLEEHFNIEPCTTVETHTERETELIEMQTYDDKDVEIEETYQEIYDKALTGFDRLQDEMEDAEPKYLARMTEVSNGLLNTALAAAQSKARLKEHKDKQTRKAVSNPRTINNNIVISREELLKTITKDVINPLDRDRIIDVDVVEINDTGKKDE